MHLHLRRFAITGSPEVDDRIVARAEGDGDEGQDDDVNAGVLAHVGQTRPPGRICLAEVDGHIVSGIRVELVHRSRPARSSRPNLMPSRMPNMGARHDVDLCEPVQEHQRKEGRGEQ